MVPDPADQHVPNEDARGEVPNVPKRSVSSAMFMFKKLCMTQLSC